jgi:hypothetical protein
LQRRHDPIQRNNLCCSTGKTSGTAIQLCVGYGQIRICSCQGRVQRSDGHIQTIGIPVKNAGTIVVHCVLRQVEVQSVGIRATPNTMHKLTTVVFESTRQVIHGGCVCTAHGKSSRESARSVVDSGSADIIHSHGIRTTRNGCRQARTVINSSQRVVIRCRGVLAAIDQVCTGYSRRTRTILNA